IAHETGRRLYTSLRENRVGRRRQPPRLRLLRLAATKVAQRLLRWCDEIERAFAASSNVGIGLKGPPNWVRRLHRVRRWVWGKILFYHAFLIHKRHAR
ncbi:MAG: hypothetical protein IH889_09380, partial [Planctomycetes bacterium]|nr:hypothetical protein [Planctomycetota bacterium]